MSIPAVSSSYIQILKSDLVQTTMQSIRSLVDRIFINPSEFCLLGHTLVTSQIISFVATTIQSGSAVYYFILAKSIFITVQHGQNLYSLIRGH